MKYLLLGLLLLLPLTAFAFELEPYKNPEISAAQWQSYHEAIAAEFDGSRRVDEARKVEVFTDGEAGASVVFTMPGHAAHPAWVTRQLVAQDGGISMVVVGYFAGDRTAFRQLFAEYEKMAEETRKKFQQ
ncbi:MAG: hypothetical protein U5K56_19330 [Halioglobus sp.]|nr:hypothetical protein [Halioglobus sp.]